jgi:sec-independent protein translocase protein TatA
MDIGAPELLIVLIVALLVLGPSRVPKLARSLGEAMHEFRHSSNIEQEDAGPERPSG